MGFPLTLGLAWVFDLKATGVERTPPAPAEDSGAAPPRPKGARLALLLAGLGIVAGAPVLAYHFIWGAGARTTREVTTALSVAVFPFVDMSEKRDQEYFSDGLSEELIDRLSHSPDLRVIARTSSFQFKGKNEDIRSIANRLGVTHLLEGSVRKAGNDVRIERPRPGPKATTSTAC